MQRVIAAARRASWGRVIPARSIDVVTGLHSIARRDRKLAKGRATDTGSILVPTL
jgi:hypothetical protein